MGASSSACQEVYSTTELTHSSGYLFRPNRTWASTLISYKEPAPLLVERCDMGDAAPAPACQSSRSGAPGDYEGRDRRGELIRGC